MGGLYLTREIFISSESFFVQLKLLFNKTNQSPLTMENLDTGAEDYASIVSNIKFNNGPLKEEILKQKKRKREEEVEKKRLAEEKYNNELQEQQYKRLMHLLNKSKFYSTYLCNKINNNLDNTTTKTTKRNTNKVTDNTENIPPRAKRNRKRYDNQNYISEDVQKKIQSNKLNLNEEQIGDELCKDYEIDNTTAKTDEVVTETPKYFNGELREYQLKGLEWLKVLYENGINGILADEMGLGKTIQIIALLCHLLEKQQDGPYLLIAPLSTIPNWLLEFERFAPNLPVVLFHGPVAERADLKKKITRKWKVTETYSTLPIVLTSFEVPLFDKKFMQSLSWRYIIIDEGHRIKNHKCQLVHLLKSCKSTNRLLLTGTPLQNNLAELWSLLNFLLPEIFNDLALFQSWFNVEEFQGDDGTKKFLKLEEEKNILSSLREILKPFMLRREKADVCLEIPPKKELVVYAPLTELQHDLYKAALNYDITSLSKLEETPIVYTADGKRPKRRCVLKNLNNFEYEKISEQEKEMNSNTSLQENDSLTNDIWKQNKPEITQDISMGKQFTDVSERNREFLINVQLRNRYVLYKKIVNHPYLIHCPLGPDYLPKIDTDLIRASGKLLVLDAMLAKLKKDGHRVLLFSTMTLILDMLEDYLSMRTYQYVRLDGGTDLIDRKKNIQTFNTNPEVFLFLISTRAGGVGLNLTGADTVIIYDCDWNPQADIQAMARCHRIGQTKPVVIYKFCTKGTIDEKIVNRAEAKRILEKAVISKYTPNVHLNNKANLIELRKLLESKDCQVVKSENEVFTKEELNKLLDRSDLYSSQKSS